MTRRANNLFSSIMRNIALEEEKGNKSEAETEIEMYAKITNFDGLKEASTSEKQIQIQTSLGDKHFCRVRRTIKGDDVKDVFTFKMSRSGQNGIPSKTEHNLDVDENFLLDFLETAKEVQVKTRYIFQAQKIVLSYHRNDEDIVIEVPNVKFEVDVYEMEDGRVCEWCKIDLEIDSILDYLAHNYPDLKDLRLNIKISHLPFSPENAFIKSDEMSPAQKATLDGFYKNFYNQDPVKFKEGSSLWKRKSS